MKIGRVVGSVVCTKKDPSLKGVKLLLLQEIRNGKEGEILVTADALRVSGKGDLVYYISSKEAAMAMRQDLTPVDSAIMGFVEEYNLRK